MCENNFWKVCEALDCKLRIELLKYLLEIEKTEFPCVNELAETFEVTSAAMSVHLKKLATAGLVMSKRADRRVYYRAFAAKEEGERVIAAMRGFFALWPNEECCWRMLKYAHALSFQRRNAIVRCLNAAPGLSVPELAKRTGMPPATVSRSVAVLAAAGIINPNNGGIIKPNCEPEATLLALTLA